MNLDYEAIEHLKLALSRLSKAKRLLQNELMKVESCNNNRLSRSVIEESYVAAIDTLNSISFALEDIKSVGQNDLSDVSFDKTLFDFESSYDENFGLQFNHTILTMIISQLNPFSMPLFRSFVSMMRPDIATTFIFHSMI